MKVIHPSKLSWQSQLAQAITDPELLLNLLNIDDQWLPKARQAAKLFPLRVSQAYLRRIQPNTIDDPLLKQVLPIADEFTAHPDYGPDPLQEKQFNPMPGLLHKYHGRVLLTLSQLCPIHCRYCFRREFPYRENNPGRKGWAQVIESIANDPQIEEVILSGGDPLSVSDHYLAEIIGLIESVPTVHRLRIHTRFPIAIPARITAELVEILKQTRLQVVMVIHTNHPQEIDDEVSQALKLISEQNITLLNQSVLLRGINDSMSTLVDLQKRLFSVNVLPYYLHQLDKVQGTTHFAVPKLKALYLHQSLQRYLPGYLVPKLVQEVPGTDAKQALLFY